MSAPGGWRWWGDVVLALTLLATVAVGAGAQSPLLTTGAAVGYEYYRVTSPAPNTASSVGLLTIPFAARATVAPWLMIDASGAVARGEVRLENGSSASLSGLTDTELRVTARFETPGTALVASAVGLVPSGHATMTMTEAIVAGMVASDILPFRISNWGTGAGGAVDVLAVRALARGSVGVGASYRLASSFQPFELIDVRYRPGNELRLRAALDQQLADARTLGVQVAYSRYTDDEWGGVRLLRSGKRVLALGSYAFPAGSGVASAYAGILHRNGGALSESIWLSGLLSGIVAPPSETLVVLGSSARLPWRDRVLLPAVDFRLLRHGDGAGQEALVGLGGSAELPVGAAGLLVVPTLRVRIGRVLLSDDAYSGVQGLELGLGVRFGTST